MGFSFGGLIQGALPVATGYFRGKVGANQMRREQAGEDADRERRSRLDALQEMLLKGQVDNFAADNQRQQEQMGIQAKGGAESRQTQQDTLANAATQADLNRKNALEIARLGATSRESVAGINAKGKVAAKMGAGVGQGDTLPASVATRIFENRRNLKTIQAARESIAARPEAFGLQNLIPGYDYVDKPENVGARAPVANIGSLVIHDRSGAAVTASEYPRLRPFIPKDRDRPEVVAWKLGELEREIASITDDMDAYYRQQGFATPQDGGPPAGIAAPGPRSPARQGAGKPMSPAAYQAALDNGYTPEEIKAEGWEAPQ